MGNWGNSNIRCYGCNRKRGDRGDGERDGGREKGGKESGRED